MIDAVIKIGGSLLSLGDALPRTIEALEHLAPSRAIVIVPGGGPFADAVRAANELHPLGDDDAHWMAILGMEQFAVMLASRIRAARLVHDIEEIAGALARGEIPVLAPYRWLREADPLPHSWDVTGDSIAAWVATRVDARRLILIKPDGYDPGTVVDRYFDRVRAPSLIRSVVTPNMLTGSWFPD